MEAVGDRVKLTYFVAGKEPQRCGETERSCEDDLTAWVIYEMGPWDACTMPSGATFIRQATWFGVRA